jgi:NADH:ubiquinone oxidoreductase subunit K
MLHFLFITENNYNTFLLTKIFNFNFMEQTFFLALFLVFLGFFGLAFNKKNLIFTLLSIELMLLGLSYFFISLSIFKMNPKGKFLALVFLALAGAEGSLGLSLLLISNRLFGNIHLNSFKYLKG